MDLYDSKLYLDFSIIGEIWEEIYETIKNAYKDIKDIDNAMKTYNIYDLRVLYDMINFIIGYRDNLPFDLFEWIIDEKDKGQMRRFFLYTYEDYNKIDNVSNEKIIMTIINIDKPVIERSIKCIYMILEQMNKFDRNEDDGLIYYPHNHPKYDYNENGKYIKT